jgi:phosphate transport system substrate-binding protein
MRTTILGILALVLVVGSCSAITMSGSTTVLPLGVALSEAYTSDRIDVSGGGTGAGLTALAAGTTDIAMASRVITTDEASKIGLFTDTLIGYDGLVFIVGNDVELENLNQADVKGIYDGSITNWKQLGGPDETVIPIGREEGSGTRDTFLEQVMRDKLAECPAEKLNCMSSAEVLQAVKQTPGSIGYVGFSYATGVNAVAYNNVVADEHSIKAKTYPLARELYLYTRGNPGERIESFLAFVTSPAGQKIAVENGFIPL